MLGLVCCRAGEVKPVDLAMTDWGGVGQQKGRSEERPDFVYAAGG